MPRDNPTVAANSALGLVLALTTPVAANGDTITNNGRRVLHVKNGSGSPINVTVKAPAAATTGGIGLQDRIIAVAAAAEVEVGPWGAEWNQPDGCVYVDYSATPGTVVRQVRERPVV